MKRTYILTLIAVALGLAACTPETFSPSVSQEPLTSVTAKVNINGFEGVEFTGHPDQNRRVVIEFPWYYPESSDNATSLSTLESAKMTANLAISCRIKEGLGMMDLTKENHITVVNEAKEELDYIITGSLKKSSACEIVSFTLDWHNSAGVLSGDEVHILTAETIPSCTATVVVSPHASISPDPSTTAINYNRDVRFTVTAQDGTSKTYTVKKSVPSKLASGMRAGSGTVMFARQLRNELGIRTEHKTTGLAVSGDYLAVNTRGEDIMLLDKITGEKKGSIVLDAAHKGDNVNFYITSDDAGHILMCNITNNPAGTGMAACGETEFKIWKFEDVNSAPELFISRDNASLSFGRKFSVRGDVDGDAVVSAPCMNNPSSGFYRWNIKDGVPGTINWGSVKGGITWSWNGDIVYLGTDYQSSDFFQHSYFSNTLTWCGPDGNVKRQLGQLSTNYVPNALDVATFNGVDYLVANQVNGWQYGNADNVWLLDLSDGDNFSGTLPQEGAEGGSVPAVVWFSRNEYGAEAIGGTQNGVEYAADVLLDVSADGNYMYLYLMFSNGCVAGVRFDCWDI